MGMYMARVYSTHLFLVLCGAGRPEAAKEAWECVALAGLEGPTQVSAMPSTLESVVRGAS